MPKTPPLKEGLDFYYEGEKMIFTAHFLSKRGHCCQSGCRHCPYGFSEQIDPNVPMELQLQENWSDERSDSFSEYSISPDDIDN